MIRVGYTACACAKGVARSPSESVDGALKLSSTFFWEAIPLAIGFHYVAEPVAEKSGATDLSDQ